MTEEEIMELLKSPDNWVILTGEVDDNPNHRYDPVNMGTYNYHANLTGKSKDKTLHDELDVYPYQDWGNIKGYPYTGGEEENYDRYNMNDEAKNLYKLIEREYKDAK